MPESSVFEKKAFADIVSGMLADTANGFGSGVRLTDQTTGSVVLTLLEAFARELAIAYEQLESVYRNAYLDTADGPALNQVVGLLGLERLPPGYLAGAVEFSRRVPTVADIAIPAGTLVAGPGVPPVATTAPAILEAGRRAVLVEVRTDEVYRRGEMVEAGKYTLMPRSIAGIETVTNPGRLLLRQASETDGELRVRARQAIRGISTGTVEAMVRAVRSCGVATVKVLEDVVRRPGELTVIADCGEPSLVSLADVRAAIEEARPAGVRVMLQAAQPVAIRVTAILQLARGLSSAEARELRGTTAANLAGYVAGLGIGGTVRAERVRAVLSADPRVAAVANKPGVALIEASAAGATLAGNLLSNGDYAAASFETPVLAEDGASQIELYSPGVRVDVFVELAKGGDAAGLRGRLTVALGTALSNIAEQMQKDEQRAAITNIPADLQLSFATVMGALPRDGVRAVRLNVVHERTGRVREMTLAREQATPQTEPMQPGERPSLGGVDVAIAADGA